MIDLDEDDDGDQDEWKFFGSHPLSFFLPLMSSFALPNQKLDRSVTVISWSGKVTHILRHNNILCVEKFEQSSLS